MNDKKHNRKVWMIIGGMAFLLFLFGFIGGCANPANKSNAYGMTTEFVKDRLTAPTTAKFPKYGAVGVRVTESKETKNSFNVEGHVFSKNAYGVEIRNDYEAIVTYDDEAEKWILEYFRFTSLD